MALEVRKKIKPLAADCTKWQGSLQEIDRELSRLDANLYKAQQDLSGQKIRDRSNETEHEESYRRACRDAWGRGEYERRVRDAIGHWADELASELTAAGHRFAQDILAYKKLAAAKNDAKKTVVKLDGLVAQQPDASRYEIYDVVEDAARQSAMRMGTVGLAFSGGGIRSATFNLGFLQGAAALGLLKQYDYLSTVSGGGYIGAWFAAWVLREGGGGLEPWTDDDVKRELAGLTAEDRQKTNSARSAALVRRHLGLEPHTGADVGGECPAPTAETEKKFNDEPREPQEPEGDRQATEPPHNRKEEKAQENIQKQYEANVLEKRRRTSQALENVQKQLGSSRVCQASSVRRWAWPAGNPPLSPKPTLEDEPEPIHHLREHSNYLAPKVGLLSIHNWTMVSVYLRNLFLNQFILLPMMLAAIAVPRLLLLLFTHSTSGRMLTLARGWLARHDRYPVLAVLSAAILAMLTTPKLVDFFARPIVRLLRKSIAGLAMLALLGLGVIAWTIEITRCMAWLIPPNSPGMIPTLVVWLAPLVGRLD